MTSDDRFLESIRALAGQAPRVAVDSATVLRRGRRRRLLRATGASVAAVAAVALGVYGGLAASVATPVLPAGPAPSAPTSAPVVPGAVVDEDSGTVRTPLSPWVWAPHDWAVLETAQALKNSRCMEAAGFGAHQPFVPVAAVPDPTYGLWVRDEVAAHGYARMASRKPANADGSVPHTAESRAASDACSRQAFTEWGWPELEAVWESAPRSYDWPTAEPEYRATLEEWASCLERHGVARPDLDESGSHVPGQGILQAPLDEQIRVGLIDVGCKEEVDFVQRIADLEAVEQLEYIERAGPYLDRLHAAQARVMGNAQALLDAEGVVVPEWPGP